MKIAAVEFSSLKINAVRHTREYLFLLEEYLMEAHKNRMELLVLPGFTGCFYQWIQQGKPDISLLLKDITHKDFLREMEELSRKYSPRICLGSYWEKEGGSIYHSSCLLEEGRILLKQSQLYLARWERELGLSRGKALSLINVQGWNIAIILSTDVFYPQVARQAALLGADLILSPIGFIGESNPWLQQSGTWQTTQLNHYFAIESAFNGTLDGRELWGSSRIHAPLPMTPKEDGILSESREEKEMVTAQLNQEERLAARREFDALTQLNRGFYADIPGLGGRSNDGKNN